MTDQTDATLVAQTRVGDMQAFAELVERYRDAAFGAALHVLGDPGAAAEVAQDAFFRAYRCLDQLREPQRFAAWLHRIAINLARNRLAAMRAQPSHVPLDQADDAAAPNPTPSDMAERSEVAELIRQLMAKLSDQQRLTFTMFYVDGYSEQDVSDMLEIPVGTVKSRLHHARARLKEEVVRMAEDTLKESGPDADFWRSATGAAKGIVTCRASGKPVADAGIYLHEPQIASGVRVKSNAEGAWEARDLIPGSYSITADHPDFVPQAFRSKHWGYVRTSVIIRPGHTASDVDFALEPGAVIQGRIVASDGSPVALASVSAWSVDSKSDSFELLGNTGSAKCGEDGSFEIGSLPGGDYYVGAQVGAESLWEHKHPVCYYPGTCSRHDSQPVTASVRAPLAPITIRLADAGTTALSVRVTDEHHGQPIAGAKVYIMRRDTSYDMFIGLTDDQGLYQTDALTRGPFQVTVGALEQGYPRWSKWVDVPPGAGAVAMGFQLPRGVLVRGRFATEDGSAMPSLDRAWCCLSPRLPDEIDGQPCQETGISWSGATSRGGRVTKQVSVSLQEGPQPEWAMIDDAGRVQCAPLSPGAIRVHADARNKEWRVVRIMAKGQTLPRGNESAIECQPGEHLDDLEIAVASNLGVVAGRTVAAARMEPLEGVWVYLERDNDDRFYTRPIESDRSGSFLFHSVPAGSYVLSVGTEGRWEAHERSRREIVVEAGGVTQVDLVVGEQ